MSDDSTPLTKARASINRHLPCSVPRCPKRRKFVSLFCPEHNRRLAIYGHPEGRYVKPWEYHGHLVTVKTFLLAHQQHVAVVAALEVMTQLLTPGPEPRKAGNHAGGLSSSYLLHRELVRLVDARVSAEDALAVVAALWLLSHDQPATLRDDERLNRAMAHAVFRLAPLRSVRFYDHAKGKLVRHRTKTPAGIAARLLGERIRKALALFLYNLTRAIGERFHEVPEEVPE